MYKIILYLALVSAIIHIFEEYRYNWVKWANSFINGITIKQFFAVNFLFIFLIILAISNYQSIIFSSSIFSLLLINSLFHILPTIKQKRYSPGLFSAVVLFIPVSLFWYIYLITNNLITTNKIVYSFLLGFFWMSIPVLFQIFRIFKQR